MRACACACLCAAQLECARLHFPGVHVSPPPFPISMEIKQCGRHQFTHSPCFDFIQSTVCIITPVPYANLLGPKYCALTNPSFVFSRYTKHQSHFCTHKHAHKKTTPPPHTPIRLHTHTHAHTAEEATPLPTEQCATERRLIRTARHAEIWGLSLIFPSSRWCLLRS